MKTLSLASAIALTATTGWAQSGPDLNFSGQVYYNYNDYGFGDDQLLGLDIDLSGRFAGSSGLGYFLSY